MMLLMSVNLFAEQRVALIIGNQDYPDKKEKINLFGKLDNPNNDAEDIAKELRKFGFKHFDGSDLKPLKNLNQTQIEEVINSFENSLKEGDIALFFYAGHGVAVEQSNYIIPVGRNFADGKDVKNYGIKTQVILDKITATGAKARIMILDACREHLAVTRGRGFDSAGFSNMNTSGAIVAYASALGQAASDGNGRNGLYTGHLLKVMREKPNQPFVNILMVAQTNTSNDPLSKSNGQIQIPWLEIAMPNAQAFCLSTNGCQVSLPTQEELDRLKTENEKLKNQIISPMPPQPIVKSTPKFGESFKDCPDCPEMVMLAGGTFKMGSEKGDPDEKPVHSVTIKPFAMGKFEITTKEYMLCVNDKKCPLPKWLETNSEFNIKSGTKNDYKAFVEDSQPIVGVSWLNAIDYIKWLSEKTSKRYRLPSESEWEYAVRANTKAKIYGFDGKNSEITEYAWYDKNSNDKTHPVGQKKPNAFGLYDMHGNVWEWVQDTWHNNYNDAPVDGSAWETTNESSDRVLRGGSWFLTEKDLRSANRNNFPSNERKNSYGFRVACCS